MVSAKGPLGDRLCPCTIIGIPSKRWETLLSAIGGRAQTDSGAQAHAWDRRIPVRGLQETVGNMLFAAAQCFRTKAPYGSVNASSVAHHSYW